MASQSNMSVLKKKVFPLMESKKLADITVFVGPEKIPFTTHKFLLSIFSDVFLAMFYGEIAEKKDEIPLPEDDPDVFKVFLSWIYTDTMNIESVEIAISCLRFADKYLVTDMKQVCSAYLKKNISSKSVFEIHKTACTYQETDLKSACWEYITNNTSEILEEDEIKYVSLEMMSNIVCEDNLILKSEVDMYDAVVKWGKHQYSDHSPENLREKLNCLLLQIRFLTMTPAQFVGSPCEDGILNKDDQLGILKEISDGNTYENDKAKQWRKPRKSPEDIKYISDIFSTEEIITDTEDIPRDLLYLPSHSGERLNSKKLKSTGDWGTRQRFESERGRALDVTYEPLIVSPPDPPMKIRHLTDIMYCCCRMFD